MWGSCAYLKKNRKFYRVVEALWLENGRCILVTGSNEGNGRFWPRLCKKRKTQKLVVKTLYILI